MPRLALLLPAALVMIPSASADEAAAVDYARDIRPLLNRHCVECHGPARQQAGLRLDTAALAIAGGDSGAGLVPREADTSRILLAVTGESDEASQMPLDRDPLPETDIDLLRRWIDGGAQHPENEVAVEARIESDHWAFQPITRPEIPRVVTGGLDDSATIHPLDAFIRHRLAEEGVEPAPEADRITLLRRVTLDLTGLLPTPAEIDAWLADDKPGAYERLVERLLCSPHYGERWGRHWLDLARYADSNGFTIDGGRSMWPYRDWVVTALNDDMPFDRFTIEQLAGDLLDEPTRQQLVATGFHRNTLANQEGGTDDEQFRVESVVDRVSTTGTVWMGLTIACAQCHDHKYDPLTQRDFYRMYAVFNNTADNNDAAGLAPKIALPSPDQAGQLAELKRQISAAAKARRQHEQTLDQQLAEWSATLERRVPTRWVTVTPRSAESADGATLEILEDQSVLASGDIPPNDTYTVEIPVVALGGDNVGRTSKSVPQGSHASATSRNDAEASPEEAAAQQSDDKRRTDLEVRPTQDFNITGLRLETLTHESLPKTGPGLAGNGNFVLGELEVLAEGEAITIARAVADHSQPEHDIRRAIDGDPQQGWAINVTAGTMNVDRQAVFVFAEAVSVSRETLTVRLTFRHPNSYQIGRFRIALTSDPAETLGLPDRLRELAAIPTDERTKEQQSELLKLYRGQDREWSWLNKAVTDLQAQQKTLDAAIPTSLVMKELDEPRPTFVQIRGNFLQHGAPVTPGVPAVLPSTGQEQPNRLDLARWLVDPQHPLTARVTVNRIWQRYFGRGLVETENDFGVQGTPPTHPELLDWLASEFIRQGWSLKSLHRLIITSHTYRQSSHARPELARIDPANTLLARQQRLRLEAETIRDVALAASGLLSHKMGGPPVHPPQPEGVYVLTQAAKPWPTDTGEDRYRRGMYTQFWRSLPHPMMPTFDAPDANTSCTRRVRSNTPLQALTLANDRTFIELAQGLAARVLRDGPDYDAGRIRALFGFTLGRAPTEQEAGRLEQFLHEQRERYSADGDAAAALASSLIEGHTAAEAAAWTATARVVLNLDEFITRE
jgi:mono/diheme cytochrome c family protein